MVNVVSVTPPAVPHYWPDVRGMIAEALVHGRDRFTLERIEADLANGKKRLWVVLSGERLVAAVVTVITNFPAKRVTSILLAGGERSDDWVESVLSAVEEHARQQGCEQIELLGRMGWRRKIRSYETAGIWLVKDLIP